jgi:CheY-like chemotaxis protein
MSYVICPSFLVQVIYCEIIYPKYYEGFALYAVSVVTINVFMAIFTVTVVIYPVRMTSVWVEFNRMATVKLEREKQSYIGYISHEMRTPLNISNIGISLLTRSLERNGDMKPELKDITDTMHQSLMAATTTLDDLMIFQYVDSKISDKAMTYEDPVNLVKDCLEFQIVNYPQLSNRIQFVCSNNMITNLECTRKLWTNKPLFNKMIGYVISFASTAIPDDGIIIVQLSIDSRISNDEESGYDAFSHANPRMYVDWLKIIISHPTFAQVSARYRKLIPDSISLDAELDGRSEPTALGLFLSRKIVKLFKGKLECIEISKEEVCLHKIRIPLESISSCNLIHQNVSEDAFREDIKPDLKADVTSIRLSPKSLDSLSSKWTFSKNDGSVFFDEAGHVGVDDKMDTFLPTDQIKLTLLEDSRHSMTVTCRRMIKKLINSQKPESRSSLRCVDLKTELQSDDSLTILQNKFDTDQSYQVIKKLNDIKLESTSYCNSCDSSPKTLKVLVADDSRPCLKMTVRIFSKLYNADCVEVMNGADAVRAIEKSFDYDLILLDNKMPVMNGYEACREIRKLGYDKPIFGITGHVSIEDMENFSESGATHIFTKPLDMQEFILYLKDIQYIPFAPKASN